jgi:hypothetical protein
MALEPPVAAFRAETRADALMAEVEHLLIFELRATICGGGEGQAEETQGLALVSTS